MCLIDHKSGISARMSITAYENLLSTAEHRALRSGDQKTVLRLSDFIGVIPSITGKVELVYEGEQEGASSVAQSLISEAIKTMFPEYFPAIEKLEKDDYESPYQDVINWFFEESGFELLDDVQDAEYKNKLDAITPLTEIITTHQPQLSVEDRYFMKEFVLWGLVEFKKLSKHRLSEGFHFKDLYGSYISGL